MADNEGSSPPRRPGANEPASDAKKHASKLVVLSSVAKVPPLNDSESLLGEPNPAEAKETGSLPPPLPRKPAPGDEGLIRPVGWTIRPGGTTTIIKLPPKTGVLPRLTSLSTAGKKPDGSSLHVPPPTSPKIEPPADGEEETKRLPPVKLHAPTAAEPPEPQESLLTPPAPVTAPAALPPPLPVTKPRAVPPPLPIRPLAVVPAPALIAADVNQTLRKATTVLRSKPSRPGESQALPGLGLEATTLLSPAVPQPTIVPASPSEIKDPTPAPPAAARPPGPAASPFISAPTPPPSNPLAATLPLTGTVPAEKQEDAPAASDQSGGSSHRAG